MFSVSFVIILALGVRLAAIRAYGKYFSSGFAGDSSVHMAIIRSLRNNSRADSVEQYVFRDSRMSYPTLFHRLCKFLPLKMIERRQWLPNLIVFILSTASALALVGYLAWKEGISDPMLLLIGGLLFVLAPSSLIFERGDASYLKLSERLLARLTSSLGYAAAALGMLMDDPLLLFLSVPIWAASILTAKFSRQVLVFELPLLSVLLLDWRGLAVLLLSWLLAFVFGGRKLLESLRHSIKHLSMYKSRFKDSRIINQQLTGVFELFRNIRTSRSLAEGIERCILRDPARLFLHYPEIWCAVTLVFLHPLPDISIYGMSVVFIVPMAVYLATSTRYLDFVGEGYRYLDYSLRHLSVGVVVLWAWNASAWLWMAGCLTLSIAVSAFRLVRLHRENVRPPDRLSEFLDQLHIGDDVIVFPITSRTGDDIAARRPKWKTCRWQPGFLGDSYDKYLEVYPFLKRDWWPIFEKSRATHVIVQKAALKYVDWQYPFHELEPIAEDDYYAAFRIPERRVKIAERSASVQAEFQPLVSIVMPVYNGADYLGQAVESALAQTYRNIEIVIVNDGSDDGGATERVAKSYDGKVRYFAKENGGVASALNFAIGRMRGDYFSWLSHDDLYMPQKIETQIDLLRRAGNFGMASFTNIRLIDGYGRVFRDPVIEPRLLRNIFLTILATKVNGCSLLLPRSAFEIAGNFDENLKMVQDNDMWMRMALAGVQFAYIPARLVLSRQHPGQGSNNFRDCHVREKDLIYLKALSSLGTSVLEYAEDLREILINKRTVRSLKMLDVMIAGHRSSPQSQGAEAG